MRYSNSSPTVNAGSMADIAFLLLIFFLVTTTMTTDQGINRNLPKACPSGQNCSENIAERNLFRIMLNSKEAIMVNSEPIDFKELKPLLKAFIDNNGDGSCTYCNGNKDDSLSDNPNTAVITLQTDRVVSYKRYVEIQDEITQAYYDLRKSYGNIKFNKSEMNFSKSEIKAIKDAYPFKISEAKSRY